MAEEKKESKFSQEFREFGKHWLEGMRIQAEFIKKERKRIKEGLDLIPKNEMKKRYNYLLEEKRKNLIAKAEFELEKKLNGDNNIYIFPGAAKEIDKHLAELIKQYEEFMALAKEPMPQDDIKTSPINLSDLFKTQSQYQSIMLQLVEKGYCQSQTCFWKDDKKGNKELMVAIVKQLHILRYYKDDKRPTVTQIQSIAKNTFGVEVSVDTIKRASHTNFDLSFLPPADKL